MTIEFKAQELQLHPEKAIYWKEQKTLIVADLHLGKITHFRKAGFPVPRDARVPNLATLSGLLSKTGSQNLIILGDLFHSDWNSEWSEFLQFLDDRRNLKTFLVKGNHDILEEKHYEDSGMEVTDHLERGPFFFTHIPADIGLHGKYNLCGHIHPAVRIRGNARQSLVLPCFFFGHERGIVPAFGNFTGTSLIRYEKDDHVFVIASKQVIRVSPKASNKSRTDR